MGTATDHTRASNPTDPTDPSPRGPVRRPVPRRISLDFASAPDLPRLRTRVRRVPRPCAGFRPTACLGYAVAPNPAHYRRRRPESGALFTQSSRIRHRADAVGPNPAPARRTRPESGARRRVPLPGPPPRRVPLLGEPPFAPRAESPFLSRDLRRVPLWGRPLPGQTHRVPLSFSPERVTRRKTARKKRDSRRACAGDADSRRARARDADSRRVRARDADSRRERARGGDSAKRPGRGPTAGRPLGQHMVVWWSAATSPERATGSEHAVYLGIRTTADSLL